MKMPFTQNILQAQIRGDINNDGLLDLYIPSVTTSEVETGQDKFYINKSTTNKTIFSLVNNNNVNLFEEPVLDYGSLRSSQSLVIDDFDNDGKNDIFVARPSRCVNGGISSFYRNYMFNDRLYFYDIAKPINISENISFINRKSCLSSDFDNDGDLDLLVMGLLPVGSFTELKENTKIRDENNFLQIKLEGTVSNSKCVGAHISLFENGSLYNPQNLIGYNQIYVGSSMQSQKPFIKHFGCGNKDHVDLKVKFPSGYITWLDHIPTNQRISIKEPRLPQVINPIDTIFIKEDSDTTLLFQFSDIFFNPDSANLQFSYALDSILCFNIETLDESFSLFSKNNIYGIFRIKSFAEYSPFFTVIDTITLCIEPVNDPPIISNIQDTTIFEDDTLNISLDVNDVDDDSLVYFVNIDTLFAKYSLKNTNLILYPLKDWSGSLDVEIIVSDTSLSDTCQFKVTVLPQNDKPSDFSLLSPYDNFTTKKDTAITFAWKKSIDVDSDSLVYVLRIFDDYAFDTSYFTIDTNISIYINDYPNEINYWNVFAFDGVDTTISLNGPRELKIIKDVSIDKNLMKPEKFYLYQNYPNPFNPSTSISYDIPKNSHVNISIYNMNGQIVDILVNENKNIGRYTVKWNATDICSGVYFINIKAGSFQDVKKCILLK